MLSGTAVSLQVNHSSVLLSRLAPSTSWVAMHHHHLRKLLRRSASLRLASLRIC